MGGESVTEHVRRKVVENTRLPAIQLDRSPKRLSRHRPASCGHEQIWAGSALQKSLARPLEIVADRKQGSVMNGNDPLLISLAGDSDDSERQLAVGTPELNQF